MGMRFRLRSRIESRATNTGAPLFRLPFADLETTQENDETVCYSIAPHTGAGIRACSDGVALVVSRLTGHEGLARVYLINVPADDLFSSGPMVEPCKRRLGATLLGVL